MTDGCGEVKLLSSLGPGNREDAHGTVVLPSSFISTGHPSIMVFPPTFAADLLPHPNPIRQSTLEAPSWTRAVAICSSDVQGVFQFSQVYSQARL